MRRFAAGLIVLLALPAHAGELQRAAADVKSLTLAPWHWHAQQWKRFGEGVALVLAVGAADKPIDDAFQRARSHTTDSFAKAITPWGAHRALEVSAVMIGTGWLMHDPNLLGAGRDSLEAQMWAAGIITPLIKRAAGRARPFLNQGAYSFRTEQGHADAYESFPSGHATNVFAAATAIAGHYNNWIVPAIVYTVATSVAASRVNDHVHWPSDVVAGALIGRVVGRGIVFRHRNVHVTPMITPHGAGVMISFRLE